MFPYAIRAIEKLTPKAFVFENVKGLLRPTFDDYFEYILLRLTFPSFKAGMGGDWREHLSGLRKASKLPFSILQECFPSIDKSSTNWVARRN
ncbi:hypothetical protein MTYM_01520 [Methylococcales bacterium]|nr:hypothetical protein MTYM_01520 [Methylococcales bacterium]